MDDEKAEAKKASQPTQGGLGNVVKLVVKTFLEEKHYRQLNRILSAQWAGAHSLSAVVRLMEAHGIKIMPEEEEKLAGMSEERMIDALVARMPNQSREQYEHFFLQLSFIASTTTRLRTALETGHAETVEEALESAENVGVLQYLLRMAVSQAGAEVQTVGELHEQWLSDTERRMMPLLQAQATQMATQKELAQARALIGGFMTQTKECASGFLTSLVEQQEQAMLAQSFLGWKDHLKTQQREKELKKEWEEKKKAASQRLEEYKASQKSRVFSIMETGIKDKELSLLGSCFAAIMLEAANSKESKSVAGQVEDLRQKLHGFSQVSSMKAKQVLSRMTENHIDGIKDFCFKAWLDFQAMEKTQRLVDHAVQESKAKFSAFLAKQTEGAKAVLTRMCGSSDSGLLQQSLQSWHEAIRVLKREAEEAAAENSKRENVKCFRQRNKASAFLACERAVYWMDLETQTCIFCMWKRETKVERMRRYGRERNERRKKDLASVKGLFRNFASELETSLKQGTPRVEVRSA
ncbi:unnamed protein product, partial [Effrenium voratum]